jgi:large subunit ribosomal protein L19
VNRASGPAQSRPGGAIGVQVVAARSRFTTLRAHGGLKYHRSGAWLVLEAMMDAIDVVEKQQLADRPAMKSGDTVRVHVRVREGDKERIQVFEGIVIGLHRGGTRATFTVRKVSFGQGVERVFPLHSPIIQKLEVVRSARVRRAKLYYLRGLKGKAARMKEGVKTA